MFGALSSLLTHDMAIDLGTANTLIHVRGSGIVVDEPSVVAYHVKDGHKRVIAVGTAAKEMQGRTPSSIEVIRPMRDGVIADFAVAEEMIKHFMRRVDRVSIFAKPKAIVCVPHGATAVEKRAIRQSVLSAGARVAGLIPEPIAAALGAGLEILGPLGSMIVDIGGGTTEVAVLSMGDIVYATSIRVGGDFMDNALINYALDQLNIHMGHSTAERIKNSLGTARFPEDGAGDKVSFQGRSKDGGHPAEVYISQRMIAEAFRDPVEQIRRAVSAACHRIPPELSADLWENGIVLTGGGALLKDMDIALHEYTKLTVTVAEDPLTCVATGTGIALAMANKLGPIIDYES
ncbi:MAG: rod shape-determining protein [Rhodobacteraceae bacterium]|nr:rod shape-determining protein [Paracoccaceae bacterium]